MKIAGQEVNTVNEDVLVLPRGTNPAIVFRGKALQSFEEFNAQCKMPEMPTVLTSKGKKTDPEDLGYKQQLSNYVEMKLAYTLLKTLEPSQIEWDTTDMDQPTTWTNWVNDMSNSGLTSVEQDKVLQFVLTVNSLDEAKLEAARADFLRGQARE